MKYKKLNLDWNAHPNDPDENLSVNNNTVILEFYLNDIIFKQFKEYDRAKLKFYNCLKYSFGGPNDEGYYMGQHRYNYLDLPWGEFYEIETDWQNDFPERVELLNTTANFKDLKHYIFFNKESTLECVAENFEIILPVY